MSEIDTRPDEPLSDGEREVAAMAAAGMKTSDIAEALGRHSQSISRSRNRPRVKAEILRLQAAMYENIQPMLQALAVSAVAGADEAVAELRSQLLATDSDGHALYSVRGRAAEALLKFVTDAKSDAAGGPGAVGNISGVIRLVIDNKTEHDVEATATEDAEFTPLPEVGTDHVAPDG